MHLLRRVGPGKGRIKEKMMNSGKKKQVFESITENQAWKIQSLICESKNLGFKKVYSMINDLIGIPSIHSLSKQEASFIIDKLQGCDKWKKPLSPWTEDKFKGDATCLPSVGQILFIRESVLALGWDKHYFKSWLRKCANANNLNELTMETARKAYIGLSQIRIKKLEA